jgi:hypothetical protein
MSGLPVILVHAAKLASRYEARGHSWPGSFRQVDSCDSPERDHGAACDRAGQALLAARPCRDTARSMGEGPRAARRGEWMVIDGDLGPYDAVEVRLHAADTIIFLDFSLVRCAWRAIRRSRESADFWLWLLRYRRQSRPFLMEAMANYAAHATLHVLRNPEAISRFFTDLVCSDTGTPCPDN